MRRLQFFLNKKLCLFTALYGKIDVHSQDWLFVLISGSITMQLNSVKSVERGLLWLEIDAQSLFSCAKCRAHLI